MTPELADRAVALVVDRIGIDVKASPENDDGLAFWPADFDPRESFRVRFSLGLHSAEAVLEPGMFAKALLQSISRPSEQGLISFSAFARGISLHNTQLSVKANGRDIDVGENPVKWPEHIDLFEIRVGRRHVEFDHKSDADILELVDDIVPPIFGMIASLLGTEDVESEHVSEVEGGESVVRLTRYERSKSNREACLRYHGRVCKACGFDFEVFYGEPARGFIEVHHVERLADYGGARLVDPVQDLVPLCSNCHSVAHKHTPPYTVNEIRRMIELSRNRELAA